jgi:hypothetical protein
MIKIKTARRTLTMKSVDDLFDAFYKRYCENGRAVARAVEDIP